MLKIFHFNTDNSLIIFANSADLDGCKKSIKRIEENITFFVILEINLKFY